MPEGIIFQSQNAHRQLRKMLVDDCLVAVVSLPAGVFNPYSGVKTSILLLDKALARRTDRIAFFKVDNDGFDLGAQRGPIDQNDLPRVQAEIAVYLHRMRDGGDVGTVQPSSTLLVAERSAEYIAEEPGPKDALKVEKERISAEEDYNLNFERYRVNHVLSHSCPMVALGDNAIFRVESGGTPKSTVAEYWNGDIAWATLVDLPANNLVSEILSTRRTISATGLAKSSATLLPENAVVVSTRATIGRIGINRIPLATNQGFKNIVIIDSEKAIPEFVALMVTRLVPTMETWASGGTFKEISKTLFCQLEVPLPPLEVQKEIVAEIEGYQKVIDGARAVVENYRPHIHVDPEWPMVELGEVCVINPKKSELSDLDGATTVSFVPMSDMGENTMYFDPKVSKQLKDVGTSYTYFRDSDVLVAKVTPCFENGKAGLAKGLQNGIGFGSSEFFVLRSSAEVLPTWVFLCVASLEFRKWAVPQMTGTGGLQRVPRAVLEEYRIPVPDLSTQQEIVSELETEQATVESNRKLIERFEKKTQDAIERVWPEGVSI